MLAKNEKYSLNWDISVVAMAARDIYPWVSHHEKDNVMVVRYHIWLVVSEVREATVTL